MHCINKRKEAIILKRELESPFFLEPPFVGAWLRIMPGDLHFGRLFCEMGSVCCSPVVQKVGSMGVPSLKAL